MLTRVDGAASGFLGGERAVDSHAGSVGEMAAAVEPALRSGLRRKSCVAAVGAGGWSCSLVRAVSVAHERRAIEPTRGGRRSAACG
jgi:hypothetical protein